MHQAEKSYMKLYYTDRAKEDIELAFGWYEKQRHGLGLEFLNCIEISIQNILRFPKMYQISHSSFHRCVINRFPFSIFYTIEHGKIIVHAVFDNRQDPKKQP